MPINYNVQAEVIDIQGDTPRDTDTFLVDSNVWYWMAYTRSSQSLRPPRTYQKTDYPAYVNVALGAGARMFQCGLSLAELSHLIEKTEREIFSQGGGGIRPDETKVFRHNYPTQRSSVVGEVAAAWASVKSLADPLIATIDESTTDDALTRLKTQLVDGYDLFILEAMDANQVIQIITDDGDFATVPGIQVFTSNRTVIQAAAAQGQLKTR